MAQFPELVYRYPNENSDDVSALRPQITLDWSADIDTSQFTSDVLRSQLVVLINEVTSTVIPTEYVSYTATDRRLILQPATDLTPATKYTVIVRDKIKDTTGRKSFYVYNWTFTTSENDITAIVLSSPEDTSIQFIFPTLSWTAASVTGSVSYYVEVDDRPDFQSVNFSANTLSTSVTPAGVFPDQATYFWRVRALTTTTTGAWSDISSFYFGTSERAHVTSRETWQDSDIFGVAAISFKDGSSNLSSFPSITIAFTSTPASTFSSSVTLVKRAQLPRNDQPSSYAEEVVTGSWAVVGQTLVFTPAEGIAANTRYEVRIFSTLLDVYGRLLDEDYTYSLAGLYSPYYVHSSAIYSRLMSAANMFPEDLINYHIYRASLDAKARYYGYLQAVSVMAYIGDFLKESIVRDTGNLNSYGVLCWVEAVATYSLVSAIMADQALLVGRSRTLGDYSESVSKDLITALTVVRDKAKEDIDSWARTLIPSDVPTTVAKNSNWDPYSRAADWSLSTGEGQRYGF